MECAACKNKITEGSISAVDRDFCSDICHLRFWKDEMPNLGGNFISDEMIEELDKLAGQERKDQYNEINNFVLDHMMDSKFFFKLRTSDPKDDD
ncbi:MAG: hypothetical protein AAB456_02175 [Patescibacteria group bacterium]